VQAGCLEIHPWGSRPAAVEKPERLTIDLDPAEDVPWTALIEGAVEVREHLRAVGLESFVKTTGGKGLHIVVPLAPRAGWEQVKSFAQSLAEAMASDSPDRFVATMAKRARTGRIFVDYLRNGRGATAVATYSTRARPSAPVSTPLARDELSPSIRPDHFKVANLPTRPRHLGADPWPDLDAARSLGFIDTPGRHQTGHFGLTGSERSRCNPAMGTAISPSGDMPKHRVRCRSCEDVPCRRSTPSPIPNRTRELLHARHPSAWACRRT